MSRPTMYPGIVALDDHARSLEDKKGAYAAEAQYHGSCQCDRRSQRCRRKLLLLIPAVISLLAITAFLVFACFTESGSAVIRGAGLEGILLPRQTTGGSTSSQDPFVGRKLYLVVVIVGIFLVIVLGIMLSAWCCRGSFQNPLCCPCYLCACCGGLACLECIGCGLCAEL